MALASAGVHADDTAGPVFSFSGFGTLGVVHSDERNADFTSSIFKPDGAGRTRSWSADVDSLLAAQLEAKLAAQWSTNLQVISAQRHDGTYTPTVEWANIKYEFTTDAFVRVGRVVMPSFLASLYRNVGYASNWARPPIEVYGAVPITKNDGADASWRMHSGDLSNTVQAIYGGLASTMPGNGRVRAKQQAGLFDTLEYGPLTLRAAYHQAHLVLDGPRALFDAFRAFGPQGNAIADKYDCNGKLIPFVTAGAAYDVGKWFVQGEWSTTESHCFIGRQTGWYATGGLRIGKFTPYAIYARATADNLSDPGVDPAALPPQLAGPAIGLDAALNGILAGKPVQHTISLGARWDLARRAALIVQADHTSIGAGSNGNLINIGPGYRPGGGFNVFSAAMVFLF
jgi:hypothetical protein